MSPFDDMARQAFATVAGVMGQRATWQPSGGGGEVSGMVLFSNPTEPKPIGDSERYEYRPNNATAEYCIGTFDGLKEAVDVGEKEYITIGEDAYFVQEVTTKFDGNTYVAHLEKANIINS
jgi:hypothetical protein